MISNFKLFVDITEYHWDLVLKTCLGRTGVPRGGSEKLGLSWLGRVGELLVLRFLRPQVTSVNPSPCVADDMVRCEK